MRGEGTTGRRAYRSPSRDEQARATRRRVLAAAHELFVHAGWTGTTVRAVAAAAGVSVPTVELAFGTKAALLKACVDLAIAGDDEPVAVLDRPVVAAAAAAPTAGEFLAAVAGLLTEGQQRSAGLSLVVEEAARADPALRALAAERQEQRAGTATWITDQLLARGALRTGTTRADAVDTVWLLMDPLVHLRLTRDRGWSPDRYRDWFADSVARLLTDPS